MTVNGGRLAGGVGVCVNKRTRAKERESKRERQNRALMSAAANYYVRRIYTHMRRCAKEMYKCLAVCFVCLSLALMMLMMIPDSDSYCYCESPNPNPNPACCLFVTLTRSILNGDVTARTHTCTAYIYMPPMYWCIFPQLRWRQAYTHTHTHTRARTPAHSLTRTTTVDVMRDFRWSREMVVGGLFVATLFAASLSFVLKPRFVHLSGALNKGSLAF